MGGIAAIAREAGHTVTGSDRSVYPPMSQQLEALGIDLIQGFEPDQLKIKPDLVIVGNLMSRGMPIVEELLNSGMPYMSGPDWLARNVLADRHVIAIAGTHGKTTTTSMTAWLLEAAGFEPGFLIGGVPANFPVTARLGRSPYFVIEADEYDTAFFDKRAKFMHYKPQTLVINNLEFDHADIYPDLQAILQQFHHLLRLLPGNAGLITNATEAHIDSLLRMGCWTPVTRFSSNAATAADWYVSGDGTGRLDLRSAATGNLCAARLELPGVHNMENAAAALLAAQAAGVPLTGVQEGLEQFRGVRRRLELLGRWHGIRVYDDFAHHPTAIGRTLAALRAGTSGRVLAVVEPRSNSMKLGAHREELAVSLREADRVWALQPVDLPWDLRALLVANLEAAVVENDINTLAAAVAAEARPGDDIVIMSNGGFGGIQGILRDLLQKRG